jgi:hypothetical protein
MNEIFSDLVSFLVYPNLFGIKGFVVVGIKGFVVVVFSVFSLLEVFNVLI